MSRLEPGLVVIVGSSGYIGRRLASGLQHAKTYRIRLLSRTPAGRGDLEPDGLIEHFQTDLLTEGVKPGVLEPGCTVVNLMYLWDAGEAANLTATKNLLEACKAGRVRRLVHCSTAAVVGRTNECFVTEDTPCNPVGSYGVTKLRVEQMITSAATRDLDVAVLRPTSVFGPDGEPLKKLVSDLLHGNATINYLKSCLFGTRRMNLVAIENVIAAIRLLIDHERRLSGEIFIVSDDDSSLNNFRDVEKLILSHLGVANYGWPKIRLPRAVLELMLMAKGRNSVNTRCIYVPKKLQEWGYAPVVRFEDALLEYVAWYRATCMG